MNDLIAAEQLSVFAQSTSQGNRKQSTWKKTFDFIWKIHVHKKSETMMKQILDLWVEFYWLWLSILYFSDTIKAFVGAGKTWSEVLRKETENKAVNWFWLTFSSGYKYRSISYSFFHFIQLLALLCALFSPQKLVSQRSKRLLICGHWPYN